MEQNIPTTPEEVVAELDDVMFPEKDLDMAEQQGGESTEEEGVHAYFEGLFETNGWDQGAYEEYYQQYMESGPIVDIQVADTLGYKQEMLDQKLKEYGIDEAYSVWDNPDIVAATRREVEREVRKNYSAEAAINAYDAYMNNSNIDGSSNIMERSSHKDKAENYTQPEIIKSRLEMAASEKLEYLVRGAPIMCSCGSHSRHLDMKNSHGIYVNQKAVAFAGDCVADENIYYFGHCSSPFCTLTEEISLKIGAAVNTAGEYLEEPDDSVKVGVKCVPDFEGMWQNVHETTLIAKDGVEEVFGYGFTSYMGVPTTASYLICRHGGLVYPLTSGQLDESYYQAPFKDYPYNDFGSEEFMEWCESNDICPYLPGTSDFSDWHRKKINDELAKGGKIKFLHEKNMKDLYKDFLDNAYSQGLDTMTEEEREKILQAKQEYLDSGFLSEDERKEEEERYAGLRLPYGDNGLGHKKGYTHEDEELYQETLDELSGLQKEIEDAKKEPDTSYNQYESTRKIIAASQEAEEIYHDFHQEVVVYGPGYEGFTEEQQNIADKIQDTYQKIRH